MSFPNVFAAGCRGELSAVRAGKAVIRRLLSCLVVISLSAFFSLSVLNGAASAAQSRTAATDATLSIVVRSAGRPAAGAEVAVNGAVHRTGADGTLRVSTPAGPVSIAVSQPGFLPAAVRLEVTAGSDYPIEIELVAAPELEESVTVGATRTETRIDDQPMRVEVLDRDEIEEKMLMAPGDVVMLLNETGGLRVQTTSPSLGAASVRVQGMRGRYTRFFSDGLPLFGDQVGALGLLQVPPMDLGQVEVIKGVASSLYGAGAMGGVVNLASRRPGAAPATDLLINRSTLRGTDAVAFHATPLSETWGLTLLGSGHWQDRIDVNDDRWADLPGYGRGVVRPRVFWDSGRGHSFFATSGFTFEDRSGGTANDAALPAAGGPYVEALETRRADVGAVGRVLLRGRYLLSARGAYVRQRHRHQFGPVVERDSHRTFFSELAVRGAVGRHSWAAGAAVQRDAYRPVDLPQFRYTYTVPGVFVQDDVTVAPWLLVSGSARLDHHNAYGAFLSPRLAVLLRRGEWSSRVSAGTGFFGPTPLTEEGEAAGLSRLNIPRRLRAEKSRNLSFDLTRAWGPMSYTATVFASRIANPVDAEREREFALTNAPEPTRNVGGELLATLRRPPFSVTANYAYVHSREYEAGGSVEAPLTPRHSAGVVAIWEREGTGRVGLEWYFTGAQRLEVNPFRGRSAPYQLLGALVERQVGRIRLFVNGENLTNVRQTRWDPLLRPSQAADGRWTVDGWAPLDGRNINAGIRVRLP